MVVTHCHGTRAVPAALPHLCMVTSSRPGRKSFRLVAPSYKPGQSHSIPAALTVIDAVFPPSALALSSRLGHGKSMSQSVWPGRDPNQGFCVRRIHDELTSTQIPYPSCAFHDLTNRPVAPTPTLPESAPNAACLVNCRRRISFVAARRMSKNIKGMLR